MECNRPQSHGYIHKITSAPKAQRTLRKRGQRDCKRHLIREFAIGSCFIVMSEATPVNCDQFDCLSMRWTRTITDILKWIEKSPGDLNLTQRSAGNWGMFRGEETVFVMIWTTYQLVIKTKWSTLKNDIQLTFYKRSRLYLGIYAYMHVHICM